MVKASAGGPARDPETVELGNFALVRMLDDWETAFRRSSPPATSAQTDYQAGGPNIATITIPQGQDDVWQYFGCFLTFYDPANTVAGQQVQAYLLTAATTSGTAAIMTMTSALATAT